MRLFVSIACENKVSGEKRTRPEVTFYKLARVCLTDRSGGANVGGGGREKGANN